MSLLESCTKILKLSTYTLKGNTSTLRFTLNDFFSYSELIFSKYLFSKILISNILFMETYKNFLQNKNG